MLLYIYYHGIIDHSGITFKRKWWQPWQPDCIFHDNHHQYFHVNFGFNIEYWDTLHGTVRQKDKIYREDIFWGKGKDVNDATRSDLLVDTPGSSSRVYCIVLFDDHYYLLNFSAMRLRLTRASEKMRTH